MGQAGGCAQRWGRGWERVGQALTALEVGEYVREANGFGVKEELKGRVRLSFPTGSSWIRNWARLLCWRTVAD